MSDFDIVKNGYDVEQVNRYLLELSQNTENQMQEQMVRISDLKRELETVKAELATYKEKNDNISDALVVAVETAKQIENSSKNIYQLEIKRVRSLYDKWNSFLNDLMKKYPELQQQYDTTKILKIFADDLSNILKQNQTSIEQKQIIENMDTNSIGLKVLINKMSSVTKAPVQHPTYTKLEDNFWQNSNRIIRNPRPTEKTMAEYQVTEAIAEETERLKKDMIKPITNTTMSKDDSYENLVDKFLSDDNNDYKQNAYSKVFLAKEKTDGFDLKEAVNPTENLEDIMKSFSFYNEDEE